MNMNISEYIRKKVRRYFAICIYLYSEAMVSVGLASRNYKCELWQTLTSCFRYVNTFGKLLYILKTVHVAPPFWLKCDSNQLKTTPARHSSVVDCYSWAQGPSTRYTWSGQLLTPAFEVGSHSVCMMSGVSVKAVSLWDLLSTPTRCTLQLLQCTSYAFRAHCSVLSLGLCTHMRLPCMRFACIRG